VKEGIMESLVRLRGITRWYGEGENRTRVLGPVDLDVAPGRLALVMGPSGSGKTTLLSILGLLLDPTDGRMWLAGEDLTGAGEGRRSRLRRRHVAFVFQQFNLLESLTAAENVMAGLALGDTDPDKARDEAIGMLERLGIADKADALPRELSGGQKQRVGIARALAMPGRLILADEPTAALDSASGESVMGLLADLARESGRAVVTVTHDPRWVGLADRVLHIEDGLLREVEHAKVPV